MKKTVKNYCFNATNRKTKELCEIAKRYAFVKNDIFEKFGSIKGLKDLYYPRKIRDGWVKTKYAEKFGLQAHQWKLALDEAFANIKAEWNTAINKTKMDVYKNTNFTDDEKHYIYYLLKFYPLLYKAITFEVFPLPEKINNLQITDRAKLHKYLKNRLRKYEGKKPSQNKDNSFIIDSDMYSFYEDKNKKLWIGISGLISGKRNYFLLTSKIKPRKGSNIRLILKKDKIEFHFLVNVEEKQKIDKINIVAIDKGYTEIITSSGNEKYGRGFNDILKKESDRLSEKNKNRNKLRALSKKYEQKNNFIKAETIKNENLGKIKYEKQKEINRNNIEAFINNAIKEFIKIEQPSTIVNENLTFSNWSKKLNKKVKRYFSSWLKGYIRERLEYISQLNGVRLEDVNAAYTSQTCHLCGAFGVRKGDKFYCAEHGEMDADYNASLNILLRFFDKEIKLWMSPQQVKTILLERLRLSNQDSRHSSDTNIEGQTESELA